MAVGDPVTFEPAKSWDDPEPLGPDIAPDRGDARPEHVCKVCGTETFRSGTRGAFPTYCPEHKPGRSSSPGAKSTPSTGTSEAALTRINVAISTQLLTLGRTIRHVEPFDGSVIVNSAQDVGQACEDVSRRDPKFRKACEDYLSKTGYIELSVLALSILTPIAMHHGIMPGRKLPPEFVAEVERRQVARADSILDEFNIWQTSK